MASCNLSAPSTTLSSSSSSSSLNPFSFPRSTSQISILTKKINIKCKLSRNNEEKESSSNKVDRRNVLLGLGAGLYGATSFGDPQGASGAPITAPDFTKCGKANLPASANGLNCCPPPTTKITDFRPTAQTNAALRVRPAAHLVDAKYVEKYNRAMSLMKALPDSDPRSFTQQANVHCAYCDGAHDQVGFPNLDLQVHSSWLFFPFHRYYLHFHEKILGKLINDPTFALPYWNWDAPGGMQMPAMFADPNSSIYDPRRDGAHQPPTVMDLNYGGEDETDVSNEDRIAANLTVMYRQMVSNARSPRLFLGYPYRAGDEPDPGAGSIENIPHGPIHVWSGDRSQPNLEDMGNFYSAGRDPLFYSHHCNVDRMWYLWKNLDKTRRDHTDPDWLDATFLFYDENANAVRVKVRDCLDTRNLGYTYQDVDLPWLNSRPASSKSRVRSLFSSSGKQAKAAPHVPVVRFPKPLTSTIVTDVGRPKKSRSKEDKEKEEEVLVISVELSRDAFVKFDVLVNDEDDDPAAGKPIKAQFAGSFVNVPHKHKHKHGGQMKKMTTKLRLGLTDLLETLDVEGDDSVVVTLVPKQGNDAVVITEVKIVLASIY
ncbi:hypothetical protein V2J09_018879 [Rumex salicifolius]